MILGTMEILAEALTFGEKSGIGSERVVDLVKGMLHSHICWASINIFPDYFAGPSVVHYADKMSNEKFDGSAGFTIDGGIKDATCVFSPQVPHNKFLC